MVKKGEPETRTALYRKYRPRSLDEFVGQSHVVEILRRSLAQGRVAHAYLLTGPKGTGKTSIARILAHEINQLPYTDDATYLDIIEIDAASNNGVEDVRELRDRVQLAPTSAAKKVYIIDEVHMLSKPAFNALLKTLEEPPAHIVFILATTDLHKVPATIVSRTQHFAIRTYSPEEIAAHLKKIAKSEGLKITDEALAVIAHRGEGSFRNSISLLDQLSSLASDKEGITSELVESVLGLAPSDAVDGLLTAVASKDVAGVIAKLDELEHQGIQPTVLADQLIQTVRLQLAAQPQQVWLLDALLSVPTSPQPSLKLLTVLIGAIKPKIAAAATAAKSSSVIIEAPLPKIPSKAEIEKAEIPEITAVPSLESPPKPDPKQAAESKPNPKKRSSGTIELDWDKLLEYVRQNLVPLYGILSKCTHELDGNELTIYTGRKFNKTKLDESKYLTMLHEALEQIGARDVTIVTLPVTKPPVDEKLAKVAEMMGGGQEVNLDETGK